MVWRYKVKSERPLQSLHSVRRNMSGAQNAGADRLNLARGLRQFASHRRTRDRNPARIRENLGAASGSSSALPNAFRTNTNNTRTNPTPIAVYTAICARLGLDFLSGGVAGSTT